MEAKQRQNDAVDRRYSRVSATQAQSVKPGMVVVIPFPKDLKGASGSDAARGESRMFIACGSA